MDSNHLKGLAVDVAFYWPELYPNNHWKRRRLANSAKKYNIDRGYDLWNRDKPHFQDNWIPLSDNSYAMDYDYIKILKEEFPDSVPLTELSWNDGQLKALIEIIVRRYAQENAWWELESLLKKIRLTIEK